MIRFVILGTLIAATLAAQTSDEEYRVYSQHPRLFLSAQRLRLLKRERERQSMRWRQFDLLVKAAAELPEPGFSLALDYAVTGDPSIGKRAVEWAVTGGADLRQLALVYDWCQPLLTPAQANVLLAKIGRLLDQKTATGITAYRDRVLALIATADDSQHSEEKPLREIVNGWWRGQLAPEVRDGRVTIPLPDLFAVLEVLHAVRDNLNLDLRAAAPEYFRELPKYQVLGNYPAPLPAPENEYRLPVFKGSAEPDLDRAALARAAGLLMVAFDNNAIENQYLQGWLIQDRFMLQGTFGAPYEFLWANPYQPGLSYFQLPLLYHDKNSGTLFLRSNWEDDAVWFGLYEGEAQLFRDGRVTVLNKSGPVAPRPKPIPVGDANIVLGRSPMEFSLEGGITLIVGLRPRHKYLIEVDDEELREAQTDSVGTLEMDYAPERTAGVRIEEAPSGSD